MREVYNGGHYQYFVNRSACNHQEVMAALTTIGAWEHAANLAEALKTVGANPILIPRIAEEFLTEESAADLSRYDAEFGNCKQTIEACLADYLDKHEAELVNWTP